MPLGTFRATGKADETLGPASQETCQVSRAIAPEIYGDVSPRPNTEVVMAARIVSLTGSKAVSERMIAGALALFLGAFFVWGAGFANSATLHEAAHDTRHAYGFPCH